MVSSLPESRRTKTLYITLFCLIAACLISIISLTFGFEISIPDYVSLRIPADISVLDSSWQKLSNVTQEPHATVIDYNSKGNITKIEQKDTTVSKEQQKDPLLPVILLWKRPFGRNGYGPRANVHCGCRYTYDRSEAPISDAVVIYCRDADKNSLPPDFPNRTTSQLYIWWCREPPIHVAAYPLDMNYRPGFFNWTMTYRRDSDVSTPWDFTENVKSFHKKRNLTLEEIFKVKNRTGMAIVGNCGSGGWPSPKQRLKFIKEVQQLMPGIDGYGKCFHRIISNQDYSQTIKFYKFYFSFENSYHCKDYISEKFWSKPIRQGLVPVVWGASPEDYAAVAPKNSYILAEAFNNTEELVNYLKYLDKNDTAYLEYLQWRSPENLANVTFTEVVPAISGDFSNVCVLCQRLRQRQKENDRSTFEVKSLKDFFLGSNEEGCLQKSHKEVLWRYQV